jgi:prevent-host-death family protein
MQLVRSVDVLELKEHTTQILRQVSQQRTEIQITRRGQPIARLVPIHRERARSRPSTVVWTSLDELASKIGAHWSGATNAVDAIREVRREL